MKASGDSLGPPDQLPSFFVPPKKRKGERWEFLADEIERPQKIT
jgi:hypothetical protein